MDWLYSVDGASQGGPVPTRVLLRKLAAGDVDGLTLVWSPAAPHLPWRAIADTPALVVAAPALAAEAQTGGGAPALGGEWFYSSDGAQTGPLSLAHLALAVAECKVAGLLFAAPPGTVTDGSSSIAAASAMHSSGPSDDGSSTDARRADAPALPDGVESGGESEDGDGAADGGETSGVRSGSSAAAAGVGSKRSRKKGSGMNGSNPWIFFSGLPADITEEEVADFFKKAGIIKLDYNTGKPRIRLYKNEDGTLKGEGTLCYLHEAGVELAMTLLDESTFRGKWTVHVEPAVFDKAGKEGSSAPQAKRTRNKSSFGKQPGMDIVARTRAKEQQAALSWAEEGDDSLGLQTVVLKHVFAPEELEEPGALDELETDVAGEAERLGEVQKLSIFSKHPEGVITIKYRSAGAAAEALAVFNGRYFGGRRLTCEYWDGVTNFKQPSNESRADEQKRLDDFGAWLEQRDETRGAVDEGSAAAVRPSAALAGQEVGSAATSAALRSGSGHAGETIPAASHK